MSRTGSLPPGVLDADMPQDDAPVRRWSRRDSTGIGLDLAADICHGSRYDGAVIEATQEPLEVAVLDDSEPDIEMERRLL